MIPPVAGYPHHGAGADNGAVVGSYASRRPGAALAGRYIFGDDCPGRVWSIPDGVGGGSLPASRATGLQVNSLARATTAPSTS